MKSIFNLALGVVFTINLSFLTYISPVLAKTHSVKDNQVWAFSIDNDLFVPGGSDADFTGGVALTYSGAPGVKYWHRVDQLLGKIDNHVGSRFNSKEEKIIPTIELGVYGFTPDSSLGEEFLHEDRPYASLTYVSASRSYRERPWGNAWSTTLTVGALGLSVFESVQNGVHDLVGNSLEDGWGNQVSNGGELTARYQVAYQDHWDLGVSRIKTSYFGSVGYLTEVGIAISTRQGLISSPDHRFNPELISYGERVNEIVASPYGGDENYFWGGLGVKVRLYNAFLQGQFRDSAHTLDRDELNSLLLEAWAGYTLSLGNSFKWSYVVRAQSSEIKDGAGDRNLVWGGFILSHTI